MNDNETYQEIFGYWASANSKMNALFKQYMECIQAFSETDNVNMLMRVFVDLKELNKQVELSIDRSLNRLGVQLKQREFFKENDNHILTQEKIDTLLQN